MTEQQQPEQKYCCITGEPVYPPYNILGGRVYSDRAFAMVNKPHPGFWRSVVVQLVGMAIFAAVVAVLANLIGQPTQTVRILLGLFLAIVPTALWLAYFYRQDRLEPEPKHRLGLVFMTALLLTDVIARRLIYDWFRLQDWAAYDVGTSLAASVLITSVTYTAITYVAVRMVYATEEFDERMDGVVYGSVAGLGIATLLNLRYIIENQGVELAPGVVQTVTTALAMASFGGLLGWFMAEAKFTHKPVWWMPAGFIITAVLNGIFSWLIGEVAASGLTIEPWRSLAMGLAVALVTFLALAVLMRRAIEVTLRRSTIG
ncbi:MAG: PrsW family intramembrane metalloprotease [Anaerolineae bacterium]|nr:PrsW family intramembrane metalloprotease [Anaerolineae bacterium]